MRTCASLIATAAALVAVAAGPASGQDAKTDYEKVLAREAVLRNDLDAVSGVSAPLLHRLRGLVSEYEGLARQYPRSGYSDNALYNAALLSADAFWQNGEETDRKAALRLFAALGDRFPKSSLNRQVPKHTARLEAAPTAHSARSSTDSDRAGSTLTAITREPLPDGLRVTLQLERETAFYEERLDGPPRVFIDLSNTRTQPELRDATLGYPDGLVRQIRVGRQQGGTTRVVLDLGGTARHSVYALYNPYRIVVDVEDRSASRAPLLAAGGAKAAKHEPGATWAPPTAAGSPAGNPTPTTGSAQPRTPPVSEAAAPAPAAANRNGGFSLSRQLGLGISRVVIDAGHGGHDPGARVKGLNEADLTLDVALRLEQLLLDIPGVEVVMTRRTDVFIPLEERTAIANRAGADLFLSVHVNASPRPLTRGVETYFLNFAPNPEAEAIAARENAGAAKTMHDLPEIVKAIALNNKIDESRDFARQVQTAMIERLRRVNREVKNLGVKQAPFMVLIGATMPSVLAEISFITNREEATLLKSPSYRQAIAEALVAGISKYQRSLKAVTVAAQ